MAYRCAPKTLCINNLIWDYRFRPDALAEALRFYKNALNRVKNKTHDAPESTGREEHGR
jgi:hypothetical protein